MNRINQWLRRIPTWPVYLCGVIPVPVYLYLAQTGGLGREPIKALEHELGELALQLLILCLAITPLRQKLGLNLLKFRRAVGLLAFLYVVLHLLVWLVLDVAVFEQIWADILKRPYISVGMLAFVLMIPLALTSNNGSLRRLGRRWHRLHKLTYLIALLGGLHFIMIAKGIQLEPLIYMGLIIVLLSFRLAKPGKRRIA